MTIRKLDSIWIHSFNKRGREKQILTLLFSSSKFFLLKGLVLSCALLLVFSRLKCLISPKYPAAMSNCDQLLIISIHKKDDVILLCKFSSLFSFNYWLLEFSTCKLQKLYVRILSCLHFFLLLSHSRGGGLVFICRTIFD